MPPVSNATLIRAYRQLPDSFAVQKKKAKKLRQFLVKRQVRTLSGVTPITVLTKSYSCPGNCLYCPDEPKMPKSYLSNEPAAMRAVLNKFNATKQVKMRIQALEANGHRVDKIELLILGGCFNHYTKAYQKKFIKECFNVCNQAASKNLELAFKKNETARYRIIGITIETRPDLINENEIKWFRSLGVTRVQLGVQHLDDQILKKVKRGHTRAQTIKATTLLKQAGFKIDYHLMPDLPFSTPSKDFKMYQELFSNPNFQPDQLKIYPTIVNQHAPLFKLFKKSFYKPYSTKQLKSLLTKMKLATPYYVRINRLIRDIPQESIAAGNKITNLRQLLQSELREKNLHCKCIRCREAKNDSVNLKQAKLFITKYPASDGTEYFISYENKSQTKLYAFLRLRINNQPEDNFISVLKKAALVRELHTYGQLVPVGSKHKNNVQHTGFGKKLMQIAEKITLENDLNKIAVIAGIGVRPYYQKLGYGLGETYMIKCLR